MSLVLTTQRVWRGLAESRPGEMQRRVNGTFWISNVKEYCSKYGDEGGFMRFMSECLDVDIVVLVSMVNLLMRDAVHHFEDLEEGGRNTLSFCGLLSHSGHHA